MISAVQKELPPQKKPLELQLPDRCLHFPRRPLLMGIVNITDDSFSLDGSLDLDETCEKVLQTIADGADIIDIGAESARTNRGPITVEEEIARLLPFLERWPDLIKKARPADDTQVFPPVLSINTWRPEVVKAVLPHGVELLNDLSALSEPDNAQLCAETGAALLIMHSVGLPKEKHTNQCYDDVMAALDDFFRTRVRRALQAGLIMENLILDPGIDFAKQKDDNLTILANLQDLHRFERPLLLPISRKTVIGDVLDQPDARDRDPGTLALLAHGVRQGAQIFRVHNVQAAWEALRLLDVLRK